MQDFADNSKNNVMKHQIGSESGAKQGTTLRKTLICEMKVTLSLLHFLLPPFFKPVCIELEFFFVLAMACSQFWLVFRLLRSPIIYQLDWRSKIPMELELNLAIIGFICV